LSLSIIDTQTGAVTVCAAGCDPPILLNRHKAEVSPAGGMPMGISEDAVFEASSWHLQEGDSIVLVTDGITEARDISGALLGKEGLLRILQEFDYHAPIESIGNTLLRRAAEFGGGELRDDVCILIARRT
jgi:sigma-B regulation protein RsbU (phosphoserine phosphatase)